MKRCSVKPYEGTEKYIFISYCHKDKAMVFPIIEQLARYGYRIWYDEGIDPGSEWPEIIAQHLNGSTVCIAFISENSLNSHNCRREINFALLKKKPFISVVLEQVQLSLGMEMQLSATQSIFMYTLPNEAEFYKKMYEAKCLSECYAMPNLNIKVSKSEDYLDDFSENMFSESSMCRDTFNDKWFLQQQECSNVQSIDKCELVDSEEIEKEKKVQSPVEEQVDHIIEEPKKINTWLVRVKTDEAINLPEGEFKIGRSRSKSDYPIADNSVISRVHAILIKRDSDCYLMDNNSRNKTVLNSKELEAEKEYLLKNGDSFLLANEKFIFHQE